MRSDPERVVQQQILRYRQVNISVIEAIKLLVIRVPSHPEEHPGCEKEI